MLEILMRDIAAMSTLDSLYLVFFGIMIFSSVLWILVYVLNREKLRTDPEPGDLPAVTFLVPAYNEEEYVEGSIRSLLEQNYPRDKLHVIGIDDGSTDNTLEIMERFGDEIEIISKENTGKASSMNLALERVDTELVGCLDGDSIASPDMVRNMVGYFERDGVKGVTPAMKVMDPRTWAEKLMWSEFIYNILLRKLFAIFDAQWVLPGPGSLYDTSFLEDLGGWDENNPTEDMEVAFRIFKHGGRIENSPNAYVDTPSPPDLGSLFRQRMRWYGGYILNVIKYREIFGRPGYGNLGFVLLPMGVLWTLVIEFFFFHLLYNIGSLLYSAARTYMLVGPMQPVFQVSILNVTFFHLYFLFFGIVGVTLLLLSVRVSDEPIMPVKRKVHYLTFLILYPALYSIMWIAALGKVIMVKGGDFGW